MSRLGELTAKVDAFFARVEQRHGADMQCQSGCSDCCHVRLTVTGVEAAALRAHITAWPAERRRALAEVGPVDRCAALDPAGRCRVYEARPLVCRSHGVPIRLGRRGLPVVSGPSMIPAEARRGSIEACHRNFTRIEPDADCVLDQETLSATLFAVDAADGGGPRVELAELLAELAAI